MHLGFNSLLFNLILFLSTDASARSAELELSASFRHKAKPPEFMGGFLGDFLGGGEGVDCF